MPTPRVSYPRLLFWLLFYAGLLPYALPRCLDWLSRSSNWWLSWGLALAGLLLAGVAFSLYQAGRWLTRYFSSRSSTPLSDD
jgi:hypothetical protein